MGAIAFDLGFVPPVELALASSDGLKPLELPAPLQDAVARFERVMGQVGQPEGETGEAGTERAPRAFYMNAAEKNTAEPSGAEEATASSQSRMYMPFTVFGNFATEVAPDTPVAVGTRETRVLPELDSATPAAPEAKSAAPEAAPVAPVVERPSEANVLQTTLNPQSSTLNPQPSTLNPQPSTPNQTVGTRGPRVLQALDTAAPVAAALDTTKPATIEAEPVAPVAVGTREPRVLQAFDAATPAATEVKPATIEAAPVAPVAVPVAEGTHEPRVLQAFDTAAPVAATVVTAKPDAATEAAPVAPVAVPVAEGTREPRTLQAFDTAAPVAAAVVTAKPDATTEAALVAPAAAPVAEGTREPRVLQTTLNPQPSTLNPQPSTLTHHPSPLTPHPSAVAAREPSVLPALDASEDVVRKDDSALEVADGRHVQAAPQISVPRQVVDVAPQQPVREISSVGVSASVKAAIEVVKTVEAIASAIEVTPGFVKGEGAVRFSLKPEIFGGAQVVIETKGGELKVEFVLGAAATPAASTERASIANAASMVNTANAVNTVNTVNAAEPSAATGTRETRAPQTPAAPVAPAARVPQTSAVAPAAALIEANLPALSEALSARLGSSFAKISVSVRKESDDETT